MELSGGILPRIYGRQINEDTNFTVQILNKRPLSAGGYRWRLSDGVFAVIDAVYNGQTLQDIPIYAIVEGKNIVC